MSASAQPVSSARFAEALQELPLSTLHNTAAEIRNSKIHLESSNQELKPHADEGDETCKEAIDENKQVLERMNARLNLLKAEVERRGMLWVESDDAEADGVLNGHANESSVEHGPLSGGIGLSARTSGLNQGSGSLSDAELARRIEERMQAAENTDGSEGEDGVHL